MGQDKWVDGHTETRVGPTESGKVCGGKKKRDASRLASGTRGDVRGIGGEQKSAR